MHCAAFSSYVSHPLGEAVLLLLYVLLVVFSVKELWIDHIYAGDAHMHQVEYHSVFHYHISSKIRILCLLYVQRFDLIAWRARLGIFVGMRFAQSIRAKSPWHMLMGYLSGLSLHVHVEHCECRACFVFWFSVCLSCITICSTHHFVSCKLELYSNPVQSDWNFGFTVNTSIGEEESQMFKSGLKVGSILALPESSYSTVLYCITTRTLGSTQPVGQKKIAVTHYFDKMWIFYKDLSS